MEQDPKPYVVYWMSRTAVSNPGYSTRTFDAGMLTLDTKEAADKLHTKLTKLAKEGGTYRGRIVIHVSDIGCLIPQKEKFATTEDAKVLIGRTVKANHPITVLNPEEWFKIIDVNVTDGKVWVIGENTCWFNYHQCQLWKDTPQ